MDLQSERFEEAACQRLLQRGEIAGPDRQRVQEARVGLAHGLFFELGQLSAEGVVFGCELGAAYHQDHHPEQASPQEVIVNLDTNQPLLDESATRRSRSVDWRTITLTVTAAANMMNSKLDVELADGSHDKSQALDGDALDQLRDAMYRDDEGTWYNASFVVSGPGAPEPSFDFENPPFGGIADDPESPGHAAPVLLLLDQEMFPRDKAHLPAWHPARQGQ